MTGKRHKLMEDLKAVKPGLPPETENWAAGDAGRRILAQILAAEVVPEQPRPEKRRGAATRLVWGAVAVVVIGVAAFLAVHFFTGSGKDDVVSHPTTSPSVTTGARSVTVRQALAEIVAFVEATPKIAIGEGGGGEPKSLLEEAQVWGLVRPSETASIQLDQPATRKGFALWLWRCFGRFLPESSPNATVSDLSGLTPEEQQAVMGLVREGVIQLPEDGAFGGDQLLTEPEAFDLLARIEALL